MSTMEYAMTAAHVAVKVASVFPLAAQAADIADKILNQAEQANYNQKYLKSFSARIHRHQESLKKCNPDSFKEETYKHYIDVLNEICSYINEMKKPGKFSQRAIWRMKKFLKAGDIADMHKELNIKLDEAINDFQLSEIMTMSETLTDVRNAQKKEQDALAQIALTLKGFAPNLQKEYIIKQEDFEDEDDDDDEPPVIRGAVRRRTIGVQYVAVKAMGQPSEKDQATLNKRVAILTALTTCENIERFAGTMSSSGTLYIVTGWAEKGDLQSLLQTESFPWDVKIKWASEIANAIKFCHAAEILHHDLKAKNVLIDQTYSVKLSNFESSRFETDATTSLKGRMSSIRWTAPEKLKTSYVPYTKKCDIYSYGIVLWEIITGKKPFYQTENDTAVAALILDKNQRPTPIPEDTPDEYKELMQSCWAPKSIDRSTISVILHKLLKLRKKYTKSDGIHRLMSSGSTVSLNDSKSSTSLPEIYSDEPEPEPATPESVTMTLEDENVSVQVGEANLPEKTWDQVLQLHKEHKYDEAFPYFEKLAKERNNEAVFYVGYYLYEGRGTKKDETEALTFLGQAADANIPRAQFMYAFALLKGSTYDAQHGIDNLKKAVNAGFPQAFEFYGDILFNGEHGLPLNTEAAEKYYKLAVDKGMNSAKPKYDQAQRFNKTLAARRAAESLKK